MWSFAEPVGVKRYWGEKKDTMALHLLEMSTVFYNIVFSFVNELLGLADQRCR